MAGAHLSLILEPCRGDQGLTMQLHEADNVSAIEKRRRRISHHGVETGMRRVEHWVIPEDEQAGANRQTSSLAALAVVLALVIVSLLLVRELRSEAAVQDCVMSGRTNCVPLATIP